ncbi:hypothetical protein [Microbacterium schleiferi]|uniref:Uncharacterized protein n=2 Tax=Microbacterium schleiferi TaxID=69362 RepID=A0ABU7V5B7_9MICO
MNADRQTQTRCMRVDSLLPVELHEKLSMTIAASDLQYVAGSILGVGSHPRSWAMSQWGVMVTFELDQTLRRVHSADPGLGWEPTIAAAARHAGKFFDGKRNLDEVLTSFRSLITSNEQVFFPSRRVRALDLLRNDVSFITDGTELVLTSLSGQFMLGFPPEKILTLAEWGPHARALMAGVGQAAAWTFEGRDLDGFAAHGDHHDDTVTWWDGKLSRVVPVAFAGELSLELALSLISIHSTVQAARRWTRTTCCAWCATASLKHRFVVLHHAARSFEMLSGRPDLLGPEATEHVRELMADVHVRTVVTPPYRRLRNGWFHLGLGDIAQQLPRDPDLLTPVTLYAGIDPLDLDAFVDRGLDAVAALMNAWIVEPEPGGATIFDNLRRVDM